MTLGRRGHYAGGPRASGGRGGLGVGGGGGGVPSLGVDGDYGAHGLGNPLLGGTGQYATLSKQCKTLESSDFY